jgi:hypothetical protein
MRPYMQKNDLDRYLEALSMLYKEFKKQAYEIRNNLIDPDLKGEDEDTVLRQILERDMIQDMDRKDCEVFGERYYQNALVIVLQKLREKGWNAPPQEKWKMIDTTDAEALKTAPVWNPEALASFVLWHPLTTEWRLSQEEKDKSFGQYGGAVYDRCSDLPEDMGGQESEFEFFVIAELLPFIREIYGDEIVKPYGYYYGYNEAVDKMKTILAETEKRYSPTFPISKIDTMGLEDCKAYVRQVKKIATKDDAEQDVVTKKEEGGPGALIFVVLGGVIVVVIVAVVAVLACRRKPDEYSTVSMGESSEEL